MLQNVKHITIHITSCPIQGDTNVSKTRTLLIPLLPSTSLLCSFYEFNDITQQKRCKSYGIRTITTLLRIQNNVSQPLPFFTISFHLRIYSSQRVKKNLPRKFCDKLFALCIQFHERKGQGNSEKTYMTALVMKDPIILTISPHRVPVGNLIPRARGAHFFHK